MPLHYCLRLLFDGYPHFVVVSFDPGRLRIDEQWLEEAEWYPAEHAGFWLGLLPDGCQGACEGAGNEAQLLAVARVSDLVVHDDLADEEKSAR